MRHIDPFLQAQGKGQKMCSESNVLAGEKCSKCGREGRNPEVGEGVTINSGSDRYPGTIIRVSTSGKTIWYQRDSFRRIDNNGAFTEMQEYEYIPNPDGVVYQASRRKNGVYRPKGASYGVVSIGIRRAYRDPHF